MHCRSPGPHPGEVEGSGLGGVSRPMPRGVSRPTPRGSPGPHPGDEASTPLPHSRRLLLWAVRILLECILVMNSFERHLDDGLMNRIP